MKTITLVNWCILGLYTAVLLGLLLFVRPSSSDDRMARGYVIMLFVPLVVLALINLLSSPFTRILVLALSAFPLVMGMVMLIAGPIVKNWRKSSWDREDAAQANGTYYFTDAPRQKLAADLAAVDPDRLSADLEQPVPALNETGKDQVTLFDFAIMQGMKADPSRLIRCLELLLKKGAQIDNGDKMHSPTHFRSMGYYYKPELLAWFLENGADANALEAGTRVPILSHTITGDNSDGNKVARVRLLLEHGANPNIIPPRKDERQIVMSMLLSAVESDLWEVSNLLLDYGADASYQTESGWNVHRAVEYQAGLFRSWGKTPPDEFVKLAERIGNTQGTESKSKLQ